MASPTLLIDADLLLHIAASAAELTIDWGDDTSSAHSRLGDVQRIIQGKVDAYIEQFSPREIIMAFSGEGNFRREMYPEYKSQRSGRKPVGFSMAREWMQTQWKWHSVPRLEADDILGIMATSGKYQRPVIVSDDKDFLQVPGEVYQPRNDLLHNISVEEADLAHLIQALTGDRADNYPGCPGFGPVKALELLRDSTDRWASIVKAYEAKGLKEADALLNARLARILRYEDYNRKTKEPILWKPSTVSTVVAPSITHATDSSKQQPAASQTQRRQKKIGSTSPATTPNGRSNRSRSSSRTTSRSALETSSST